MDDNYEANSGSYMPYLQDGEKHVVEVAEFASPYWQAFYGAFANRFPQKNYTFSFDEVIEEPIEEVVEDVIEEVVEEAVVEEVVAPCKRKKSKKNFGAITVGFIAALLAFLFAIVKGFIASYIKAQGSKFLSLTFTSTTDLIQALIEGKGLKMMMDAKYAIIEGCFILAVILIFIAMIVLRVAMSSRKTTRAAGVLGLFSLIATIAAGALQFFAVENNANLSKVLVFVNPLKATGLQLGYYIFAALVLVVMICGFAARKKNKKK